MEELHTSPFHKEISSFLIQLLEKKVKDEGLEDSQLPKENSFEELITCYHDLISKKQSIPLEQKVFDAFPPFDYPLKMYRGLPRVYKKDAPSQSHIKTTFSHLPSLKQRIAEKLLLPYYDKVDLKNGDKISIFTYVLGDGYGDIIAHKEAVSIIKKRFPNLFIQSVLLLPSQIPKENISLGEDALIISYKTKASLPKKALNALIKSDLILSIPTSHPQVEALKSTSVNVLSIGEHGFIETDCFHPKSTNLSMGLHFLEAGIFIREDQKKGDYRALKNETLLYTLFGTLTPQTVDIETYLHSHKLHLAYLQSPIGGAVYLHALLKAASRDERMIDICTPDIGWLIEYVKIQGKEKKPFFTEPFGIQELEIHYSGKIHQKKIQESGKKVRILCTGPLEIDDFSNLMRLSEEFVAVRGDQSLAEAVSANRLFFYDGAPHKKYFIKDLLALAENRIRNNMGCITLFRSIAKTFFCQQTEEENEWVEETFFQTKEPWEKTAEQLSFALLKRETIVGCKLLNQIIRSEYAFNQTLCQLVAREILFKRNPELKTQVREDIDSFAQGKVSFGQIQSRLESFFQIKSLF